MIFRSVTYRPPSCYKLLIYTKMVSSGYVGNQIVYML
ncbi:Uncharacterised protein [Cedecea neteri]|uniref:Uncharacterized protein n=1 Tax=Cedecea neteri TaxID=158822 RepID=A0A2X3IXZ9_9ENTR|nr:Uncharacterised protein [Cedecea neteri]